jgi:dTDP-4-dehydrorhamnose 3,5-epimerase
MNINKTEFDGLLLIEPDVFGDERGYFYESWNKEKFRNAGVDVVFVQDNISKSGKGTIRGLHYQAKKTAQDKLCYVIQGKVLDIAVDIRFNSPTFGKHYSVELSEENKRQLFIPKGFAHGFSVLEDNTVFMYKVSDLYSPKDERTIRFDDPALGIDWKVKDRIISYKDLGGVTFDSIEREFFYWK